MQKNKLSPVEQLRLEKRKLKALCLEDEQRLSESWDYLTDNAGSLIFNSVLRGTRELLTGGKKSEPSVTSVMKDYSIFSIVTASLPVIWDVAQPMLVGYMLKKIKSIFTRKKKKKKRS